MKTLNCIDLIKNLKHGDKYRRINTSDWQTYQSGMQLHFDQDGILVEWEIKEKIMTRKEAWEDYRYKFIPHAPLHENIFLDGFDIGSGETKKCIQPIIDVLKNCGHYSLINYTGNELLNLIIKP